MGILCLRSVSFGRLGQVESSVLVGSRQQWPASPVLFSGKGCGSGLMLGLMEQEPKGGNNTGQQGSRKNEFCQANLIFF